MTSRSDLAVVILISNCMHHLLYFCLFLLTRGLTASFAAVWVETQLASAVWCSCQHAILSHDLMVLKQIFNVPTFLALSPPAVFLSLSPYSFIEGVCSKCLSSLHSQHTLFQVTLQLPPACSRGYILLASAVSRG